MRFAPLYLLLALGAAVAQPQPAAAPREAATPTDGRANQRIQRIHIEDGGSAIDELRHGGQTQRIRVQPKADVPAYEVLPEGGAQGRTPSRDGVPGPAGSRVWNVLNF
ncbi:hypothetical protein [Ramlibacter sp. 2FC]|uniref:hypothetical protein n=1 Tax=Ramlibacter sp. 2FC TaxID=2502188 RepID=UPI0010F4E169|nr:hypothetical protein [Ramlibacter sp. 2FC]